MEKDNTNNHTPVRDDTGTLRDLRYEARRMRSVHLSILAVLTVAALGLVPSSLSLGWREVWMMPLFLFGTAAAWVLHIRQIFSEKARLWIFACLAWGITLLDGVHTTSLFDISVTATLELVLFSQADEKPLLQTTMIVYFFQFAIQVAAIFSGNSVTVDTLVISQIIQHAAIVVIVYLITANIIKKRREDREADERIIRELTNTRRRTENFMANVSHELRTPVNVVTGLSAVMEERLKDPRDRQDAAHIREAGRHLSDQVDDILDFTEIETSRFTVLEAPYSIASLINDVLTALGVYIREDLPHIIVDVDHAIPARLIGDSRRIRKVLYHMMDNAIKFTGHGAVYVNLYQMRGPHGLNLCMDVRDTGIGMSRETLERVREGIYQEDAERNRVNTGFGLGLRLVYGIVHSMNGFVRMESEPGYGTRIHVSIPQKAGDVKNCMEIKNPSAISIAYYQKPDKYDHPEVARYYMVMIGHLIEAFGLTLSRVGSLNDLVEMMTKQSFSHLFVAEEEYGEDPAYFDEMSRKMHVVVVARGSFVPGRDSRVTILKKPFYAFPVVAALNARDERDAKRVLYDEEEIRFDGLRVLVVDDEEMNLVVARGIFSSYGMTVETASSGPEAITMAKKTDYDLIFMDHMMPVMDGVEASHRIRDVLQMGGRKTVIIALTANAVSGAREMFMEEGFDGFVAKPIERTELERSVRAALAGEG